ncbi:PilN domain-containing protein [Synechococcus elongatus]|uniref:PilN domain-containing protein n=1 Tax=Synechococcus elongatus TaxID=32046 RepID=UPI000F7E6146|nr:PilN domain-containing protein [Synechococcus elongatus]
MYSLDINFLKERTTTAPPVTTFGTAAVATNPSERLPLWIGVGIGLLLPGLALVVTALANNRVSTLTADKAELEQQIQLGQPAEARLKSIQAEIEQINTDTTSLIQVFPQVKSWSAILTDLSRRTPVAVQISKIEQAGKKVTLQGSSSNYDSVNDLLLTLQQSRFFTASSLRIEEAKLGATPTQNTGENSPKLSNVNYRIVGELSDVPTTDLLQNLRQLDAQGLAARLQGLVNQGVLKP